MPRSCSSSAVVCFSARTNVQVSPVDIIAHSDLRLLAVHPDRHGDSSTFKHELVYETAWLTRAEARLAIFDYLERFYNGQRMHSALGYLSPIAFERQHEQQQRAA